MNIYLLLFLTFLKIGSLSFGGGLGMISLLRDEVVSHSWLTDEELLNLVAVAESTPGPIAVNIATFVGAGEAGFFGGLLATLGVVLPSFIIILIIASLIKNLMKYKPVKAFLSGIRPAVIALILGMSVIMLLSAVLGVKTSGDSLSFDYRALAVIVAVAVSDRLLKAKRKKPTSPIVLILISALVGMGLYAI